MQDRNQTKTKPLRVVVLGEGGVGKSALVVRFIAGRFLYQYDPTLEDEYAKEILLDGDLHELRIVDTAGQGEWQQGEYLAVADAVLIAFSLTDECSLERARTLGQLQGGKTKIPAVLVGTKQDKAGERSVSYDNASAVARELQCCYVESSAACDTGVTEAFNTAVKLALRMRAATLDPVVPDTSKLRRSGSIRKSIRRLGNLLKKGTGV